MPAHQVAVVGSDAAPVLAGVRVADVTHVTLLVLPAHAKTARHVTEVLGALGLTVTAETVDGDVVPAALALVTRAARAARAAEAAFIVNVGAGHGLLELAALSAAHLNGSRAIATLDGDAVELPVLRSPWDDLVSGSKMAVLTALAEAGGEVESLGALATAAGIDKSLLSYHLRGTRDARGLEELGLVEIDKAPRNRLVIRLSVIGKTLVDAWRDPA